MSQEVWENYFIQVQSFPKRSEISSCENVKVGREGSIGKVMVDLVIVFMKNIYQIFFIVKCCVLRSLNAGPFGFKELESE